MVLKPPSIAIIWPVIHEASSESKKEVNLAISPAFPILCSGCLFAEASRFSGVDNSCEASGVSVKDGAMALHLIFCAENSAARLLVRPSTAHLLAETEA